MPARLNFSPREVEGPLSLVLLRPRYVMGCDGARGTPIAATGGAPTK
jgi:hypothetical protein